MVKKNGHTFWVYRTIIFDLLGKSRHIISSSPDRRVSWLPSPIFGEFTLSGKTPCLNSFFFLYLASVSVVTSGQDDYMSQERRGEDRVGAVTVNGFLSFE